MPSLWVPNQAAEAVLQEAEGRREARRMVEFRQRLRALDPRMGCFCATRDYPEDQIRAGFWYLYRRNDDGTVAFWEVTDSEGGYREPGEDVIHALQAGDANRTNLKEERYQQRRADEARRRKREQDAQEERYERVKDEFDYAFRVQIPVNKSLKAA